MIQKWLLGFALAALLSGCSKPYHTYPIIGTTEYATEPATIIETQEAESITLEPVEAQSSAIPFYVQNGDTLHIVYNGNESGLIQLLTEKAEKDCFFDFYIRCNSNKDAAELGDVIVRNCNNKKLIYSEGWDLLNAGCELTIENTTILHFTIKNGMTRSQALEALDTATSVSEKISKVDPWAYVNSVHAYIILGCEYDNTNPEELSKEATTAYGCLVKGSAVCQGYANTFKLFMDLAGIECRTCVGIVAGDIIHAWNLVKLDEKWYRIDCTWDDTGDKTVSKDYFLTGYDCSPESRNYYHTMFPDIELSETSYRR